jgi:NAD-dependent SIR2 family protein deacetylase
MRAKRPNAGHRALARLETAGAVHGVLTQNVDGLHQASGSRRVLELHGALAWVRCLRCGRLEPRDALQLRLERLNPDFASARAVMAPDGDAELDAGVEETFHLADCRGCGGTLKPDVVFFGENVPRPRVARSWAMLERAEVLLVLGSSLTVRSGYRYVVAAAEARKPVALVNDGPTRGDGDATLRVHGRLGRVLPALADRLLGPAAP